MLTDRASSGSGKVSEWIAEIHEWLQPMTKASLSVTPEHLEELIQQLRTHNDDILDIPKGLATVLRIMHHLAVPPPTHSKEGRALLTCMGKRYVFIKRNIQSVGRSMRFTLHPLADLFIPTSIRFLWEAF